MSATIEARVTRLEKEQETMWLLSDTIAADCSANRAGIDALDYKQRATMTEIFGLVREVSGLKATLAEFGLKMMAIEDAATETNLRITRLEVDMSDLKSDVAGLKVEMSEVKADVAGLKVEMSEVKADVAELKSDVAELKSDVAGLKSEMSEVKATQMEHGDLLRAILSRLDGPARN